jgi:hypothetical protein
MPLTYDGTDGLFTRLGRLIYMMDAVRSHQTNLKTLLANVQASYSSTDAWMIDSLSGNIEARISEAGGVLNDVRSAAERTLIEMTFAEANTSGATNVMRAKTLQDALTWLIRQMDTDAKTVDGTTISKTSASYAASNIGNGRWVYNTEAPNILLGSTNDWPNIRSETLEARCVQDATNGAVVAGSEVFEVRGQPAYPSLDYRFPAGSGSVTRITTVSAGIDGGRPTQNLLTNSDLEDQTSNLPDRWTIVTGTAGTHFATETGTFYRGGKSLKLLAGTGTLFNIRQQFSSASGTFGRMTPDRPYVLAFAAKKDAGATGTIRFSVKDASGNIIDGGAFNTFTTVAALTTSWDIYTLTLRSPRNVPSDIYFHIESTVTVATAAAYIDEVVLAELTPIGAGGQAVGIIAGATDWRADDNGRFTFTNNDEGQFVRAFDRLFDMYRHGLSLPANYSNTETIADSLIV